MDVGFVKSENKNNYFDVFLSILSFSDKYRLWIILSVLSALACAACDIYSVNLIKQLVDKVSIGRGDNFINTVTIMVAVILIGFASKYFVKYSSGKLGTGIIYDIRNTALNKIRDIEISEIDKSHSGDLVSKLSSNLSTVENFLTNNLTDYIYIPLTVSAAFIYLSFINWKLLLISFASTPIALYLTSILSSPVGKFSEKYYELAGKSNCVALDAIKGISILKAFNLKDVLHKKYKAALEQAYKQGIKAEIRNEALLPIVIITYEVPYILCAIFGGYMAVNGQLRPGSLIAFIQLLRLLIGPSTQLPNMISNYRNTMGAAKGIFYILDAPTERKNGNKGFLKDDEPVIEFHNVSFGYNGTGNVLHNISFKLYKGEKIAIVGASGCGKSTIINLICGFYTPTAGCIKLYGSDMNDLSIEFIREQLSLVPQESLLLPGTIEDNIKYGKLSAGEDKIIEAAKSANIHGSIMEMTEGYSTRIAEYGSTLSGGQKQRISIARAILKDTQIFLLDEPTSALDYHSEMLVSNAIEEIEEDKSMIIITHRLSSIKNVDRILVLNEGTLKLQEREA